MAQRNVVDLTVIGWGILLCCAASLFCQAPVERADPKSVNPLTVALVVAPGEGEHWQAIEGQLLAALSGEDIELVERQQLSAVLDELRLAMADVTETGSADALAKLVPADVFVFVESRVATDRDESPHSTRADSQESAPLPAEESKHAHRAMQVRRAVTCHVRVVETRTGIVLAQMSSSPDGLARDVAPAISLIRQAIAKAREDTAGRHYVAVLGFQSEESGESLRPVAKSLKDLLSAALSNRADVVLLEREQLRLLSREETLADAELNLCGSSALLLGGVRRSNDQITISVRVIPVAEGTPQTVSVESASQALGGTMVDLEAKLLSALRDSRAKTAGDVDTAHEADAVRRRLFYLARLGEYDEATVVGEALVVLHPSKQNLEAMMSLLLVRWPQTVYKPFVPGNPPWTAREDLWYESQEMAYLATRMMEVEQRLCGLAEKLGEAIAYPNVSWLRFRRYQETVSYQFLPLSHPGAKALVPPADPLLRRRYEVLRKLCDSHQRAKLSYLRAMGLSPNPLAWQLRFAVQLSEDAADCEQLIQEAIATPEEFGKEWYFLPGAMYQALPWVLTVAEERFGHDAVAPIWERLKGHPNSLVQAAGAFGEMQAGGAEAKAAERELIAFVSNADVPVSDRVSYLNGCLAVRWAFEPAFGRDALSAKSWRRHNDARDRLTGLAARAGIELAMASLASPTSEKEATAAMGLLTRSVDELSGQGDLAEHLEEVLPREIANRDWERLAATATILKTAIQRLSGPEADELIALLAGVPEPASSAESGDAYRRFLTEVSQCRSLRASLPKRFQSIETGGGDGASEGTPWDEYELQEIPITDVPENYAGGRWDNILLSGNQLILIWLKGEHCYVSSLPVTGGRLRFWGRLDAPDPMDMDMMLPLHWATLLNDTLYVARSWGGDESTAHMRVLEGKQPVSSDWPALLVVKGGKVVKGYSEDDGLPGRSINTMAAFDGKLYLGIDYRRLSVTRKKGHEGWIDAFVKPGAGALASFDPATESFEVLASSRHLTPRNPLDGGGPWGVSHILPDPKRQGLWLRICETTPNHSIPSVYDRSGVWKYEPDTKQFKMLNDFPGQMGWFDEGRLSDIGLHVLDIDGGGIATFGPDRPYDRTFTLPNGKPHGPIGKGLEWPFGEGQVRYCRLGDYVLDGLVLCDPQTDRAYPLPRGGFGLTPDFNFRLPNDGGVLIADRADFRIYRIARKTGGPEQAGRSAAGELRSSPPRMPPAQKPLPTPKNILVLRAGYYHILNTETGELSDTRLGQYRGSSPQRAFTFGPSPAGLKPDGTCGRLCCQRDFGLISEFGDVVMPFSHRSIMPFREGLAAVMVEKNGLEGLVDLRGNWVIPPQFDGVRPFSNGRAAVSVGATTRWLFDDKTLYSGGKWGFCDRQGKLVAPTIYKAAQDYSEGLAAVFRSPYGWGYIDLDGCTVIPHQYGTARPFKDGVAWVSREEELRYSLVPSVPYWFDPVTDHTKFNVLFYRQVRMPSLDGHWELIDRSGHAVTKRITGLVTDFHEGLSWFRPEGQDWGCVSPEGSVAVETRYAAPLPFSEGLARAGVGAPAGRFGFVDTQGRWAVPPRFTAAESFSEGLAAVCTGGDLTYDQNDYNVEHRPVGGRWGYVNRCGEWVFPPQFEEAGPFFSGVARVVKSGRVVYITLSGKVLLDAGPLWATTGCAVLTVVPGSTAEKAGVQVGDVVLRVDDRDVATRWGTDEIALDKARTYYMGRGDKVFTVVAPPGILGVTLSPGPDIWSDPSTITPEIAAETPPIERTDATIIPYRPEAAEPGETKATGGPADKSATE
ncbi:MAG: WG repeat-containing protein [Planctomycetota bacterium]|jgi:hypothetical protein